MSCAAGSRHHQKATRMSKPASNQTRLHAAKAIARHRKQQEQRAIEQMVTDTPNRAQRRKSVRTDPQSM